MSNENEKMAVFGHMLDRFVNVVEDGARTQAQNDELKTKAYRKIFEICKAEGASWANVQGRTYRYISKTLVSGIKKRVTLKLLSVGANRTSALTNEIRTLLNPVDIAYIEMFGIASLELPLPPPPTMIVNDAAETTNAIKDLLSMTVNSMQVQTTALCAVTESIRDLVKEQKQINAALLTVTQALHAKCRSIEELVTQQKATNLAKEQKETNVAIADLAKEQKTTNQAIKDFASGNK